MSSRAGGRVSSPAGRAVYVSFNYRLGPFGYLDFTPLFDAVARTFDNNLGLRDQLGAAAMGAGQHPAVRRRPGNVTVFGESAGGNAVIALLATPTAEGLFARAIAQSAPPSAMYGPELTPTWAAEFVDILRAHHGPVAGTPPRRPGRLLADADGRRPARRIARAADADTGGCTPGGSASRP